MLLVSALIGGVAATKPSKKKSPGGKTPATTTTTSTPASASKTPPAPARPAMTMVGLHAFARSMGLEAAWVEQGKTLRLHSKWSDLLFEGGRREISINGLRVFLGEAPGVEARTLTVSPIDRDRLLLPVLAPQSLPVRTVPRVIAIDPGHGGKDTGTRNPILNLEEKNFTLDVALRLKPLLEANGFKVILTRSDDTFIPLPDRPATAAAAGAELFVSIHFNAAGSADVRGLETYVVTPQYQRSTGSETDRADDNVVVAGNANDGWNAHLGHTLHRGLVRDLGLFDRGLKRARFVVLREAQCPAVLVEGGYLSHLDEAKRVATPAFRQKLAETLAAGIDAYRQTLERLEEERAAKVQPAR
jgi:N-acetylmuramoyl-L-alanine amidase